MLTHVKVLAALHIVFGAMGLVFGLGMMLLFGGIAGFAAMNDPSSDAFVAIPILGAISGFILILALAFSIPGIIAGIGLLTFRPWARILTIVISAVMILHFPFGTALAVYGLWVLLSQGGAALFQGYARRA